MSKSGNAKYAALVNKLTSAANKMEAATRGKGGNQQGRGQGRRRRNLRPVYTPAGGVLENHWNMVRDPCFATLAESAYRGRAGILSRFTGVNTYSSGTATAGLFVYNPASVSGTVTAVANSASGFSPVYDFVMPGQAYLVQTADTYRVVGMCADIDYVGTELNRSGMIYGGVLTTSSVQGGVGTTVDKVKVLLSNATRTPDREIKQLWFPGVLNEEYSDKDVLTNVYGDACNALVLCFENMPPGLQIRIRITTIYEWLPRVDTGIIMPSPLSGTNPQAAYEKLFERAKQEPGFVDSFTQGAAGVGKRFAYAAGQAAATAAGGVLYNSMRQGRQRSITFQ